MNSHRTITRAVFPVAGLGTRFLPATKASPKEMLPIVDKPLIQYAVEEAAAAGITEMIFVTGRNKRAIEDHFDKAYELEVELAAHQKYELLGILRAIKPDNVQCFYVRQPEALGLGHAVLCAEKLLNDQPFAVILADDLLQGSVPVMQQMIGKFKQTGNSIVGVEQILPEQTRSYGVVGGMAYDDKLIKLNRIVEKPAPEDAPSDMGVIGRYVLTPSIFDYLRTLSPGAGKELQLTDAIAAMLKHETVLAYQFEGKRYDCGSKLGYLEATVEFALKHPEVKEKFRHLLKEIIFEDGSELVDIPPYMRPTERMVVWNEY
ncbi:MAG: UTP--glucose-1-phosphate uridylyltransferase GalU [Burkholderiaceae bacterium]